MGSNYSARYRPSPCPVCKARDAYMGSSTWRPFNGMACSEECGVAAGKALASVRETEKHQRLTGHISRLRFLIAEIEEEAISNAARHHLGEGS